MKVRRFLFAALVAFCVDEVYAQSYSCQITANAVNPTISCTGGEQPPPNPVPPNPTPPNPTPPPTPSPCTDQPGTVGFTTPDGGLGTSGRGNTISMPSQIASSGPLPVPTKGSTGEITITEGTGGPKQLRSIEVGISDCRGWLSPGDGNCYFKAEIATTTNMFWFVKVPDGYTLEQLLAAGYCDARGMAAPKLNLRYTFDDGGSKSYIVEWYNGWLDSLARRGLRAPRR